MTDAAYSTPRSGSLFSQDERTRRRNTAERRFRIYGQVAIGIAMMALVILLASVLGNGLSAFRQTFINMPVTLDAAVLDKKGNRDANDLKKSPRLATRNYL